MTIIISQRVSNPHHPRLGSVDHDTQVAARPPSRGGLAFDLVFGEQQELAQKVERLKKRQKSKAPKLPKKTTKAQVQKKLIEADLRRQQQTVSFATFNFGHRTQKRSFCTSKVIIHFVLNFAN